VPAINVFSVASLAPDDDIRHDTRDGDRDDTFLLLDRLLEDLPEVVERFVLPVLDSTATALLARLGRVWRAVAVSSDLPCAGITEVVPLSKGHGVLRVCRATRVGESERLPVGRDNVYICRSGRADRGAYVGTGARLPVGRVDVCPYR
jgi:hypothetical protein